METNKIKNKMLESFAWGIFIVTYGVGWFLQDVYQTDFSGYTPVVIGLILMGLNLARAGTGISVSKGSLTIGILSFTFGSAGLLGYALPLIPAIVIVLGVAIIIDATELPEKWHIC
jgi:hypothetical protein